ncbi:MAG: flap endonuclease-1 [Candidatus Diapherotrites archaeon]|uniref:Flap endonuclease 1 n=1 Tax=Candidatus Iainarchaeum sp. TaxID=3101447 RepID=A0A2D6M0X7_9ARCH|nr:flap endonuclease-1 [Candidatus Diapherotrites archaeon]
MGTAIRDLLKREEINLDYLNGRTVGIDSHNMLYQFLSTIRGRDGTPLMDSKGRVTSHLTGLLYRTVNLIEREVNHVFVFDGKPPELKGETLRARHKIRTEAAKKFEDAKAKGEVAEAKKYAQQAVRLTKEMIEDAKKLISLMGLPIVQAPSEGEAQIATMVTAGKLYGAISQDYDALLFGTPLLFRNITISGKRKVPGRDYYYNISPEKIDLKANLEALGIDRRKLIWIGLLVGTDFNKKFPKVGAKTALKLVTKFDRFEEIIENAKYKPDFDYKEIENIFMNPASTDEYDLKFELPKMNEIKDLLVNEHDFGAERVENALKKLQEKIDDQGKQSRLSQWG